MEASTEWVEAELKSQCLSGRSLALPRCSLPDTTTCLIIPMRQQRSQVVELQVQISKEKNMPELGWLFRMRGRWGT